jgi:pyruvate kinase
MRHTKIVATVGPASSTPDGLRTLMAAGVDVFRLNFSHGSHDTHAAVYRLIREGARDLDRHVAVLRI